MKFFNSKPDEQMIKLLKDSQQDFNFAQDQVKNRLLVSIHEKPIDAPSRHYFTLKFIKYSASSAGVVIFLSGTIAMASNAKPGDKLFALNKFGEKIILNLPLSMEQKAKVQAGIVTRRLEDLQAMETKTDSTGPVSLQLQTRQLETVKESDESIKNAIETVTKNKQKLDSSGQTETSRKLGKVLNQIDTLAAKHEEKIKSLEAASSDQKTQQAIDEHLTGIKNARHQARVELKLQKEDTDSSED